MKFRKTLKITSRISSVTNGFVQAIIPSVQPSEALRDEALKLLGMSNDRLSCVYCGSACTDWDHLRPLVQGKRPSGYFNEIRNLVPSCGPCNQSKSGQDWRDWMKSSAKGSPKSRGIVDLDARFAALERFEAWSRHEPVDLRAIVGSELWDDYWNKLERIESQMREAQKDADVIRHRIMQFLACPVFTPRDEKA